MLFKKHLIEPEKLKRYGLMLLTAGLIIFVVMPFLPKSAGIVAHFIMGFLIGFGAAIVIGSIIKKRGR